MALSLPETGTEQGRCRGQKTSLTSFPPSNFLQSLFWWLAFRSPAPANGAKVYQLNFKAMFVQEQTLAFLHDFIFLLSNIV